MPIFEYRCADCEQDFELLVRRGERLACPHCQSARLEKLLSSPSAHVSQGLPVASQCAPVGPPCSPTCCRL